METASPTISFGVLLHNVRRVEAALCALNKRAERKKLPLLSWSWGKPVTERQRIPHPDFGWQVDHEGDVTRVALSLSDVAVRYEGWSFVAALQHLDGENIVRALPGEEVPALYRERGPVCDHCAAWRRRHDTYLVRHEDGSIKQVGSTCMGDFLGGFDGINLACRASMLAEARAIAEDGMEGFGCGGGERTRTLAYFLPVVAWFVRESAHGWVPRSKAKDVGRPATADLAWLAMDTNEARKLGVDPSEVDKATAEAAEAWAENLSDADIAADRGDYLHNLRAVARTGLVTARTAGIAASMIVAYQRHVARERELAESAQRVRVDAFVGAVKQRVTFGLPQAVGKKGKPLKGAPVVLSTDPVWLEAVIGYDSTYGYTTVLKFRSTEGHLLVWKSHDTGVTRADVGKRYTLSGTIKAHSLYEGTKQTVLTRCDVKAVDVDPSDAAVSPEPATPAPQIIVGAAVLVVVGTYERRGIVAEIQDDGVAVHLEPDDRVTWFTRDGARRFRLAPLAPFAVGAQVTSNLFGSSGVVTDTNPYGHCRIRLDDEPMGSWYTPEGTAACFTLLAPADKASAA